MLRRLLYRKYIANQYSMKNYHIYLFTQDACNPCVLLKKHIDSLPEGQQQELDVVPMKVASGQRTALAEELDIQLTPTLVVCHEDLLCDGEIDGDEFLSQREVPVERIVGAINIIASLQDTLAAYTYALDPD